MHQDASRKFWLSNTEMKRKKKKEETKVYSTRIAVLSTEKQKEILQYNYSMPQPSILNWYTGCQVQSLSIIISHSVGKWGKRQLEQHKTDLVKTTNKTVAEASPVC